MNHDIIIGNAKRMDSIGSNSVQLVVTSPPYPMIEMWDEIMGSQNPEITKALKKEDGSSAFELMHQELDKVWEEVYRVLTPGGFACINIGDATRTINDEFALYPNHSRILSAFLKLGATNLPNIIWRKQTNAPNKFMGSGMLPSGAYVTLEHEWILIFRKGAKRKFKTDEEKKKRKESSFFWEERNVWFSDLWELKGVKQKVANANSRSRSAAYPFEIPYRLINMYSMKGDTVLDPFVGTGTTMIAAIASERSSIGIEIDPSFLEIITSSINNTSISQLNDIIDARYKQHEKFVLERALDQTKSQIKHHSNYMNFPVMTLQEQDIFLSKLLGIEQISNNSFYSKYEDRNKVIKLSEESRYLSAVK